MSGRTALVVEDNQDVREVVAGMLGAAGFRIVPARHGQEAQDLLVAGLQPQVVVLDLMMPVLDGWRFLELMRADPFQRDLPVVALSAFHLTRDGRPDVDAFVAKPFEATDLLRAIDQAIGSRTRRAG